MQEEGDSTPMASADKWGSRFSKLILRFFRTMWKHRCEILALEHNATLEQRQREEALEVWNDLRLKWWVFRPSNQYLLDKERSFFLTTKFVNVYVWRRKLKAALICGKSLQENKSVDIQRYLRRVRMDDRASFQMVPT